MNDFEAAVFFIFPFAAASGALVCGFAALGRCAPERRWGRLASGVVVSMIAWAGGLAATLALSHPNPNQIASGVVPLIVGVGVGFIASAMVLGALALATKQTVKGPDQGAGNRSGPSSP